MNFSIAHRKGINFNCDRWWCKRNNDLYLPLYLPPPGAKSLKLIICQVNAQCMKHFNLNLNLKYFSCIRIYDMSLITKSYFFSVAFTSKCWSTAIFKWIKTVIRCYLRNKIKRTYSENYNLVSNNMKYNSREKISRFKRLCNPKYTDYHWTKILDPGWHY